MLVLKAEYRLTKHLVAVIAVVSVLCIAGSALAQAPVNPSSAAVPPVVSTEIRASLTQPSATILTAILALSGSVLALIGSVFSACFSYKSMRKQSAENLQLQRLLRTIDSRQRTVELLRDEHLRPFFAELIRNKDLALSVRAHTEQLQQNPLAPAFKRQLLSKAGIVHDWGDSLVALANQRFKVLLALSRAQVKPFNEHMDALSRTQMGVVLNLLQSFEFSDTAFTALGNDLEKSNGLIAELWVLARNAILLPALEDDGMLTWPPEELRDGMRVAPVRLKFEYLRGAYSWSVAWRIPLSSEPKSTADFESFCLERDRLYAAVKKLDGLLDAETESKDNDTAHYSRITVQFSSERHLKKFLCQLPDLKVQSKILWAETNRPEELTV